jgi:hypothetical protein
MKLIITLLFFITTNIPSFHNNEVYVCGSKDVKKYHYSKTCRGLNACKHEIVKKSKSDAENLGLTLCGFED